VTRTAKRLPLLLLAIVALVAGVAGGLQRLGWSVPVAGGFALDHGPLMIAGFLGTLITLERAIALARPWAFVAPVLSGLGALALLAGIPHPLPPLLASAASLLLVVECGLIVAAQAAWFFATMAAGAGCWLIGNLAWLRGQPIPVVVSWWVAFLVLTIAGERLELSRVVQVPRAARSAFVGIAVTLLAGLVLGGLAFPAGARVVGFAFLGFSVWFGRYDVARRTVHQRGLTRFMAVCLLSGYVWLGVAGLLALHAGAMAGGFTYDAVLHAVLVGFVFAMIFGHAPVIFPAVLGIAIPFSPTFYGHLGLLHASLIARILGDLWYVQPLRSWGSLFNALAVLLFFANTVRQVRVGLRQPSAGR